MVFDQIMVGVHSAEKIDPDAARDPAEPVRRQTFVTLVVAHIVLLLLGALTFSQLTGEHKGKSNAVNYPGNRGGWDSGNDLARVVVTVFGSLVLMVADVLVNDPSNFPQRFTKSYREAITAVRARALSLSLVALYLPRVPFLEALPFSVVILDLSAFPFFLPAPREWLQ